jgi:hypothetical protein
MSPSLSPSGSPSPSPSPGYSAAVKYYQLPPIETWKMDLEGNKRKDDFAFETKRKKKYMPDIYSETFGYSRKLSKREMKLISRTGIAIRPFAE